MPRRRPNADLRTREHLTEAEIERLIAAAKGNRHGHRDATMVLTAYRHDLRAAELVDLRWDQIDFQTATLHVRRVKQGTPSTHPCARCGGFNASSNPGQRSSLRRSAARHSPPPALPVWSAFIFTSQRGAPFVAEHGDGDTPFMSHTRHGCHAQA